MIPPWGETEERKRRNSRVKGLGYRIPTVKNPKLLNSDYVTKGAFVILKNLARFPPAGRLERVQQ